jgi:hypothetical protein
MARLKPCSKRDMRDMSLRVTPVTAGYNAGDTIRDIEGVYILDISPSVTVARSTLPTVTGHEKGKGEKRKIADPWQSLGDLANQIVGKLK